MIEILIKEHVCRFICKTNAFFNDFGSCDSSTLVNIHRTYCIACYGCELWNIVVNISMKCITHGEQPCERSVITSSYS